MTGNSFVAICAVLLLSASAMATESQDVRGVQLRQEGLRVIDKKCLVCHNIQRIEAAARAKEDVDKILRRMEGRGVPLTNRERLVIGHFWRQNPFKSH